MGSVTIEMKGSGINFIHHVNIKINVIAYDSPQLIAITACGSQRVDDSIVLSCRIASGNADGNTFLLSVVCYFLHCFAYQ